VQMMQTALLLGFHYIKFQGDGDEVRGLAADDFMLARRGRGDPPNENRGGRLSHKQVGAAL